MQPVKATEERLITGENKLFKVYGVWAKGKQNISSGELKDLELIDFIRYQPDYDEIALQKQIKKASANWKAIKDKDSWLAEVRGGEMNKMGIPSTCNAGKSLNKVIQVQVQVARKLSTGDSELVVVSMSKLN